MTRRAILSGSTFEERIGYARAVVDGDRVHVSGTTGFDYAAMTIADDVVDQAEQCLRNVAAALAEAGCVVADVVRVRYLLPVREDFAPCWPLLRRTFGEVRPAATMMVCGLADERMRIEIEVDAHRGRVDPDHGLRVEAVAGDAGGDDALARQWRVLRDAAVSASTPAAHPGAHGVSDAPPPDVSGGPGAASAPGGLGLGLGLGFDGLGGAGVASVAAGGPGAPDASGGAGDGWLARVGHLGAAPVGCLAVRPPAGPAREAAVIVWVPPAFRGRGIGTALYRAGLAEVRGLGAGAVDTEVRADDADGLRFAASQGFAADCDRPGMVGDHARAVDGGERAGREDGGAARVRLRLAYGSARREA